MAEQDFVIVVRVSGISDTDDGDEIDDVMEDLEEYIDNEYDYVVRSVRVFEGHL